MSTGTQIPAVLQSEQISEHRYRFGSVDAEGRDVVFGGQMLAQMIVTASGRSPGKEVKSIHAIFARVATITAPLEIAVDSMHAGRSFGSDTLTVWQGNRLCARALVLMHAGEPDLIRHGVEMPAVGGPEQATTHPGGSVFPGAEMRVVGDADIWSPDAPPGPAELSMWIRYADAPNDPAISQAILAWATNGMLIGTAMRPHREVSQAQPHAAISTGVITDTLTFHEPVDARDWLLIAHESPYAGRGRSYGRAHVFTEDGRLIASFVQESMIRSVPEGQSFAGQRKSAM